MKTDLEGSEVLEGGFPGVGTRLLVNGRVFEIVYVPRGSKRYRFTAEEIEMTEREKRFIENNP